jgi:hypothetical protein
LIFFSSRPDREKKRKVPSVQAAANMSAAYTHTHIHTHTQREKRKKSEWQLSERVAAE